MLIPMSLARPERAYYYAHVCTVTSVAGGVLGYVDRRAALRLGRAVADRSSTAMATRSRRSARPIAQWGAWIILLKGMTPIPYKIVTITSGFAGYDFLLFVLLSIIARGMRFYLLAFLLHRYGARAREIIEKRLGFWATLAAIGSLSALSRRSILF